MPSRNSRPSQVGEAALCLPRAINDRPYIPLNLRHIVGGGVRGVPALHRPAQAFSYEETVSAKLTDEVETPPHSTS